MFWLPFSYPRGLFPCTWLCLAYGHLNTALTLPPQPVSPGAFFGPHFCVAVSFPVQRTHDCIMKSHPSGDLSVLTQHPCSSPHLFHTQLWLPQSSQSSGRKQMANKIAQTESTIYILSLDSAPHRPGVAEIFAHR